MRLDIPTENAEQKSLFVWAGYNMGRFPELEWLHAIPNGATTGARQGACLVGEGVKKGVPDMCLPVARGGYHGLYIEMKRTEGGTVSKDQKRWIDGLTANGYCARVCKGWQEAADLITGYLTMRGGTRV